jgi:two-component system, OmpR family, sensor kinase
LSILKAEVDLALAGERSREELEAALRSASEETDRVARLAEDLLVLARVDEGRLTLSVEPIELGALARLVGRRFAACAGLEGRSLSIDGGGVRLTVDPLRMDQALSNLIDNALRYGEGDVRVSTFRRNGQVEVHVTDGGTAFPEDLQERAFDRFVRADGGSARAGAGLGLSIVAAIARAHDGTVHAENRPEGGADVWISLPATD